MKVDNRKIFKSFVAFLLAFLMIAVQMGPAGGAKIVRAEGSEPVVYGEDDLEPGITINFGDKILLDKPLKFQWEEYGWKNTDTVPAGTEITIDMNTGYDRFWNPYIISYNGVTRTISISSSGATDSYSLNKIIIQNVNKTDEQVEISSYKMLTAFSGHVEGFGKYDILVGAENPACFEYFDYAIMDYQKYDRIIQVGDGTPFTANGIDANGNFINQAGDIVFSSSGNNAWRVIDEYSDGNNQVYVVEPYNFEAYVNVNVEEGIEVTGVTDGKAPVFGIIRAKSKNIFAVYNKGYYTTIIDMSKDDNGYYNYELLNITGNLSIENRKVLYTKYDLMEGRAGDIFMPVDTYHIARDEETPTFGQFMVKNIQFTYESDLGDYGTQYEDLNSGTGFYGDLTIYPYGKMSYSEDWGSSGVYTYTAEPMVDENTHGNSWVITDCYDSSGGSGSIKYDLQGYYYNFYTRHEAVAPTCTQDGTVEYWTDIYGDKFADDAGKTPIDDITDPATGHAYEVTWNWTQTADGYSAQATFECGKCHDIKVYDAEVSKDSVVDVTYYTAKVNFDGVEYSAINEVEAKYTFEVENGRIIKGQKDYYDYADEVTVRADSVKDGKKFAGWYLGDTLVSTSQSYTFYVKRDMVATARYEEVPAEEQAVAAVVITRANIANNKQKVVFSLTWSLPSGYRLIESGIVRAYDSGENLDLDHVNNSAIKKHVASNKTVNGNCNFNLTVSETTKLRTIYATAYVKYLDRSGATGIMYSPVQVSAYK